MNKSPNGIVQTSNLIKNFDLSGGEVVRVLKGVEMKVDKGEFIAIMGPSGSGKSTLLNILSTLETISEGKVFIAGVSLHELNRSETLQIRRKKSSIVFQNFALIPYLTAKENVKLPMLLRKESEKVAEKRALKLLTDVGLYSRRDHLPEQLSGGEKQRVAIARALAHDPDIIYADEPTGNLDTHTGREIIFLFKKLAKEQDVTIIMVTHDHSAASQTERIYILQNGRVIEEQVKNIEERRTTKK